MGIICEDIVTIPLNTKGTKISFEFRVPTSEELNDIPDSQRVQLTSLHPWNPESVQLSETTSTMISPNDDRESAEEFVENMGDSDSVLMASIQESVCLPTLRSNIVSTVKVSNRSLKRNIDQVDVPSRKTMVSTERHTKLRAAEIGDLWAIGPQRAKDTLKATTQRGD